VIVLLLPLLLWSGAAFLHGSFEMFPTEEQEGKTELSYGLIFAAFVVLEFVAIISLHRISKRQSV
jgi:hypothetical protein